MLKIQEFHLNNLLRGKNPRLSEIYASSAVSTGAFQDLAIKAEPATVCFWLTVARQRRMPTPKEYPDDPVVLWLSRNAEEPDPVYRVTLNREEERLLFKAHVPTYVAPRYRPGHQRIRRPP